MPLTRGWSAMKFANKEHTIETLVGFFNQDKINLIPRFQRSSV
jgi:hypothetical protein